MNKRLCEVLFKRAAVPNNDCELLVSQLKKKFVESTDRDTKVKILSIFSPIWSTAKIHGVFDGHASIYMIKQTKKLVEQQGILCGTVKKIGSKTIDENTRQKVHEFYRSDDISRACLGMRDYVRHEHNGKKKSWRRRNSFNFRSISSNCGGCFGGGIGDNCGAFAFGGGGACCGPFGRCCWFRLAST